LPGVLQYMTFVEERSKGAELDAAERALTDAEQQHGKDAEALVPALESLADLYTRDGLCGKAELLYKRIADIVSKSSDLKRTLQAYNKQAEIYRCENKWDDAEAIYLKLLSAVGEPADNKREIAEQLACLAGVYMQKRDYGQSRNALAKAAQLFDESLGAPNNYTSLCYIALAVISAHEGKNGDAELFLDKSTATALDTTDQLGTDQRALIELAQEYFKQDRYAEVEMLLSYTIFSQQLKLWPEHPRSGQAMHDRGELFLAQSRHADAEKAFKRALDIRLLALGQAHPELAQTAMSLAAMYVAQGRFSDAEPVLKQAMKTRVRAFGVDHPSVAAAIETFVSVLKNTKRQSIAQKLEARARDIRSKLVWHSERASASGRPPAS
jgi:tetratricopeptide (TPR) repeat protein